MQTQIVKLLASGAVAATLLSGCIAIDLKGCGSETVKGSGRVVSETRPVERFDSIKLEGQGNVIINKGEVQSLVIRADGNIIPHIETIVRNRKLII